MCLPWQAVSIEYNIETKTIYVKSIFMNKVIRVIKHNKNCIPYVRRFFTICQYIANSLIFEKFSEESYTSRGEHNVVYPIPKSLTRHRIFLVRFAIGVLITQRIYLSWYVVYSSSLTQWRHMVPEIVTFMFIHCHITVLLLGDFPPDLCVKVHSVYKYRCAYLLLMDMYILDHFTSPPPWATPFLWKR